MTLLALHFIASVVVQPPACRPDWFDTDAVGPMIAAETGTVAFARVAFRIVDCDHPTTVEVVATNAVAKQTRVVSLADAPAEARLRTLVLAVAEIRMTPKPPESVAAPSAVEPVHAVDVVAEPLAQSLDRVDDLRVALHGTVDLFASSRSAIPGARVLVDVPVAFDGVLTVGGDVGFGFTSEQHELGRVALLIASVGARAAVCPVVDRVRLCAGPRMMVGWAHASGTSNDTTIRQTSGGEPIATAGLFGLAQFLLNEHWTAELDLGLSVVLDGFEARADDATVIGVDGIGVGVGVGVGRRW